MAEETHVLYFRRTGRNEQVQKVCLCGNSHGAFYQRSLAGANGFAREHGFRVLPLLVHDREAREFVASDDTGAEHRAASAEAALTAYFAASNSPCY
jgi:hypothetical protein